MRRKQGLFTIKPFLPMFFWQKCDICHEEFKKEAAWKVQFPTITRIICQNCAPDSCEIERLALTWGESGTLRPSALILWGSRKSILPERKGATNARK